MPIFIAALVAMPLLIALLILVWDRLRTQYALRRIITQITTEERSAKLEVWDGAWGELQHAINRVLQQKRAYQQLHTFLPMLPTKATARLSELRLPTHGMPRQVTVLTISLTPAASTSLNNSIAQLHAIAATAHTIAETHNALFTHVGATLTLVFGAFEKCAPTTTLQQALYATRSLREESPRPTATVISVTSGIAQAVVLPGCGYTIIGRPIERAATIHAVAATRPLGRSTAFCDEESYVALRKTHTTAWKATSLNAVAEPVQAARIYAIAFFNAS